jgi:hypothetical protein
MEKSASIAAKEIAFEDSAGQALFDEANLRPECTGLPFVVFISQKVGARHDVRIKLARAPKVRAPEMLTVAVRPAPRLIRGKISSQEFSLVRQWAEMNEAVLVDYWNGDIEYTEDALAALKTVTGR